MSRESNSPSLFRVLAREALVEYTAAATVAGVMAGVLYLLLPANGPSVLFAAFSWSALSFTLYLSYILRSLIPVVIVIIVLGGGFHYVFQPFNITQFVLRAAGASLYFLIASILLEILEILLVERNPPSSAKKILLKSLHNVVDKIRYHFGIR